MSTSIADLPPLTIFLSYVRDDDKSFDITGPFKQMLGQLITGLSGRPVQIFLDRDDIPLGENWQNVIEAAVMHSYFFVPIFTGSYPRSEACREEFLLFQNAASQRNVNGLIIPVLWFGLESLLPEGEDEISDYVRTHQAAIFEDAWVQGPSSPDYRKNMIEIAKRILQVAPEVDSQLAAAEMAEAGLPLIDPAEDAASAPKPGNAMSIENDTSDSDVSELDADDEEDFFELTDSFQEEFSVVTLTTESLVEAIKDLGNLPQAPASNQLSPAEASRYMITAANVMKTPAEIIGTNGQKMFHAVEKSDEILKRIVRLTRSSGSDQLITSLHSTLAPDVAKLQDIQNVSSQLEFLLDSMKAPEALSASVRRAVRPARHGIVAVQDSITLMSTWSDLVDTLLE